jgi:tetratricopeptide (TPR) repeat protein
MALQVIDAPLIKSLCGHDDIRAWRLMSDTSTAEAEDYEKICPTCHQLTKDHFISLPNLELPKPPRSILNEAHKTKDNIFQVPTSSREHEHSWKWVARCFAACISLSRGNETLSKMSLAAADVEFERMLVPQQDPKVILALNLTLQILHVHDQGEITKSIMASAYSVAERVLDPKDPVRILVRWMVLVADLRMKNGEIRSPQLLEVHQEFVQLHGPRDHRSIASLYCYGYMLNVERKLPQAEHVLREVYKLSSAVLGPKHLQSISALTNLHRCLHRQGRADEAIEVLEQAIAAARETLGESHPRRLESMRLLGVLYEEQGRLHLTEILYWLVLEGRIKMMGRNHPYTLGARKALETLLKKRGKWGAERPRTAGDQQDDDQVKDKGKGKSKDSDLLTGNETHEQLRIIDLFEWDPDERWDAKSMSSGSETGSQLAAF